MVKKLFKIGMVMSLLLTTMAVSAQENKAEFPRYSWKSNWSLGFGAVATWDAPQHSGGMWRRSINAGGEIFMMHRRYGALSTRYRLTFPALWKGLQDDDGMYMARYTSFTVDFMGSITEWCKGYDPDRRHNWYVYVGAGAAVVNFSDWVLSKVSDFEDNYANTRYAENGMGRLLPAVDAGIGYSLQFSDSWSFYTELEFNVNDYHPFFWEDFADWTYTHGNFHIGLMKNFGLCKADQAIVAQKSLLTQENFDALNNQVNNLEGQVASARNNEKRLENRIAQLEDQLKAALANQGKGNGNDEETKKLQATIDQIKADQLNFYAMPFSVQYEVNEWQVSEEEMDKVKAVARVLKDNSDAKIMVVGFADYTGSDQYNMKLSEKRANEVKRLLTKKYGIAEDRITVDYKGKSVAFGDIQYALNRRVSFYRVID